MTNQQFYRLVKERDKLRIKKELLAEIMKGAIQSEFRKLAADRFLDTSELLSQVERIISHYPGSSL